MVVEYLRGLCQDNRFAREGFEVLGETVRLKDVSVPLCAIACETDHIAAWKSSYNGFRQAGSKSKKFILSQSGHIAGIINPPSKKKYGHYVNDTWEDTADAWQAGAAFDQGSWWPTWENWLKSRSGKQVAARVPGATKSHPVLDAAPGTYVNEKPK
jgi:polyhydroxyalkanoate synthase